MCQVTFLSLPFPHRSLSQPSFCTHPAEFLDALTSAGQIPKHRLGAAACAAGHVARGASCAPRLCWGPSGSRVHQETWRCHQPLLNSSCFA